MIIIVFARLLNSRICLLAKFAKLKTSRILLDLHYFGHGRACYSRPVTNAITSRSPNVCPILVGCWANIYPGFGNILYKGPLNASKHNTLKQCWFYDAGPTLNQHCFEIVLTLSG